MFIGGNHEASNYLQELPYGGWVAPNIYYLGYASVVKYNGIRIAGLSGIYKAHDYFRGHFEYPPYSEGTKRSVYHQRQLDVFRLSQLTPRIDICLSHDWPQCVTDYGNVNQLLRFKPYFREDVQNRSLGSKPCEDLLKKLRPNYWFSAHLHCKFSALIPHEDGTETKFLALDKCLPKRRFLQILEIDQPEETAERGLHYDLEWLAILAQTNSLLSVKHTTSYMPGPNGKDRYCFTPSDEEKRAVAEKFDNLKVPENFERVAPAFNPASGNKFGCQPEAILNKQTTLFCEKLGIDDPLSLVLMFAGKELNYSNISSATFDSSISSSFNESFNSSVQSQESPKRAPLASSLPIPVWIDKGGGIDPNEIALDADSSEADKEDEDQRLIQEFTTKYSTPFMSDLQMVSTPRTKLVLPSPKFDDSESVLQNPTECKPPVESNHSYDTPSTTKKFKRRNQDIYASPE